VKRILSPATIGPATTTASSQPEFGHSLAEWCINEAGGDPLIAVDLAVTAYEAMRHREESVTLAG
jgi:hypothetical protein